MTTENGTTLKPVTEIVGGEPYSYYPLGKYVVRAPGVCGGRPTFKYTRIETAFILQTITMGESIDAIVSDYHHPHLNHEAIHEAITLANKAFNSSHLSELPVVA